MWPGVELRTVDLRSLEEAAVTLLGAVSGQGVVWLTGELGTGKTTFAQMMVAAAGGGAASSPSFTLVNEYQTDTGPIYHADCYRLRSPEEGLDLQLWELARIGRLLLVEWPERAGDHAPRPDFVVELTHTGDPALRGLRVKRC